MGRPSTGIYLNRECRRIELQWMLKNGYIKKGYTITGVLGWVDGGKASVKSVYSKKECYLRLAYVITDSNGKEYPQDYRINLVTVPSNLGKGEVLYFECPESGFRAKILYQAYGYRKYVHRDWYWKRYKLRIYYQCQQSSKRDYHNDQYHELNGRIERMENELFAKYRKRTYKGKLTKDFQRYQYLKNLKNWHDQKRLEVFTEWAIKNGYNDL